MWDSVLHTSIERHWLSACIRLCYSRYLPFTGSPPAENADAGKKSPLENDCRFSCFIMPGYPGDLHVSQESEDLHIRYATREVDTSYSRR